MGMRDYASFWRLEQVLRHWDGSMIPDIIYGYHIWNEEDQTPKIIIHLGSFSDLLKYALDIVSSPLSKFQNFEVRIFSRSHLAHLQTLPNKADI
jgi:hypothetical protein